MKSITIIFENWEFEKLKEVKKDMTWHDFVFQLANYKNLDKNIGGKENE